MSGVDEYFCSNERQPNPQHNSMLNHCNCGSPNKLIVRLTSLVFFLENISKLDLGFMVEIGLKTG